MSVASAGTREVIHGRVEPGPVFVVGDRRIPWDQLGEVCVGAELTITYDPTLDEAPSEEDGPFADAVALLAECLPRSIRGLCPRAQLTEACDRARSVFGWTGDDEDEWTATAMEMVVAPPDDDPAVLAAFDAMEPTDWLAAVIELVRCGAGTLADADSLVALAARCLDVDSAAADPKAGPRMRLAFAALIPIWRALGAVDDNGALTALGAWGIPVALARAWGGDLP